MKRGGVYSPGSRLPISRMTVALIIFVISVVVTAVAISAFLWRRFAVSPPEPWENAASIAVIAFAVAIAISWGLSWLRILARGPLLVAAIALATLSAAFLYRRNSASSSERPNVRRPWLMLSLAPLVFWIAFSLWRGAIVPVLSHDALSYHLPKAVMIARAHQVDFFNAPDPRISTSPPNYEILLADVLLLTNSDEVTEWVGTAAYLALLLLGAALVERWWGGGPHVNITILLLGAVPVILLHSGAHKNDLLSNTFYLAALLWGGRWLAAQETAPLLLTLASLAAAGGTKLQGVFLAAALVIVCIWLMFKRRVRLTRTQLLIVVASAPIAFLLFGGWSYAANLLHTGQVALPASSSSDAGYGDWNNLWEVPLLLLLRPFDSSLVDVYVPWRGERWFWPHYELYFSDFGMLLSLLALALPLAIRRYATQWGADTLTRERSYASIAAANAFLLMLPIHIRPMGFFAGFPRYFAFIAVFVLAWTIAPLVKELLVRNKTFLVNGMIVASALIFIAIGADYAANDTFQPLEYVRYVAEHPGTRQPHFARYRAATIADSLAGPNDTMAIHAGFDSWIYPLYGSTLQRKVVFIESGQPIPEDAKFVLVDRAWNIIWGNPRFEDMGQYKEYLTHGAPSDEDLTVLRILLANREKYELAYYFPARNQAVFRRRDPERTPQRSADPSAGSSGSERKASPIPGK